MEEEQYWVDEDGHAHGDTDWASQYHDWTASGRRTEPGSSCPRGRSTPQRANVQAALPRPASLPRQPQTSPGQPLLPSALVIRGTARASPMRTHQSPTADTVDAGHHPRARQQCGLFAAQPGHRPPRCPSRQRPEPPAPRRTSLRERHPGDMSHRPLDVIKRERKRADRQPHLHNRHRQQPSDMIDSLDLTSPTGSVYHHDGPYDATLLSRNRNKKYAPLEAVKDTNMEAIKATPHEYIRDSLTKHVPLQGTAVVPPGMPDVTGHVMDYQEGADLMREPDAAGGAYKRWPGVPYLDGDLKGKGEPSYTLEKDKKERKARLSQQLSRVGLPDAGVYEMQPGTNGRDRRDGPSVRQRSSVSDVDQAASPFAESHAGSMRRGTGAR